MKAIDLSVDSFDEGEEEMTVTIVQVQKSEKEILRNLLEKYFYEFSQYYDKGLNELGLYGYDYLDNYWTEEARFPFFIKVDGKLAGFALVNDYPEAGQKTDYTLSEFFIIYKYRHQGVAQVVVKQLFDRFQGSWQLMYHPRNVISQRFWTKAVSLCDKNYQLITDVPEAWYNPDTQGHVLIFNTRQGS